MTEICDKIRRLLFEKSSLTKRENLAVYVDGTKHSEHALSHVLSRLSAPLHIYLHKLEYTHDLSTMC